MDFLNVNSGSGIPGGGSSAIESLGSFRVKGTGATLNSGAVDLLIQVEKLMVAAKDCKILQGKTEDLN